MRSCFIFYCSVNHRDLHVLTHSFPTRRSSDRGESLQHVVVDGGSDDGTLDVIAEYPHIELIHEPSPGIYVAMNCGIAAARHEVIGIVNADDLLKTGALGAVRSEEHTSELQSLMRISYAVFCLKKKTTK